MCEDLLVCGRGAPFSKPIFRSRHIPMYPTDGGGPLSAPEERVTAYAYNISFRVRCCLRETLGDHACSSTGSRSAAWAFDPEAFPLSVRPRPRLRALYLPVGPARS